MHEKLDLALNEADKSTHKLQHIEELYNNIFDSSK